MDNDQSEEVRRLVKAELEKYGLNTSDPDDTREVLRWTKAHMQTFENVGGWIARSIVLVVVTAIILALWEGVKHYIRSVQGQ